MKKLSESGLDLVSGTCTAGEERPFLPPPVPVIVADAEHDGERWDGLS